MTKYLTLQGGTMKSLLQKQQLRRRIIMTNASSLSSLTTAAVPTTPLGSTTQQLVSKSSPDSWIVRKRMMQIMNSSSIWKQSQTSCFHSSTTTMLSESKDDGKEEENPGAKKKKRRPITGDPDEDLDVDDDACPPWQNPLLHNDPEMKKIFAEDFGPGEKMEKAQLPPFEDPNDPDKVLAPAHIQELATEIVHLSMLEMNELVNKIADHFGFEKPPFSAGGGGAGAGEEDDEEEDGDDEGEGSAGGEEKTVFDVKLTGFDAKSKIKVIKEVRALAGLGLKEAKEMVESAPAVIQKDIKKEAAEEIKQKLEELGATVEIV